MTTYYICAMTPQEDASVIKYARKRSKGQTGIYNEKEGWGVIEQRGVFNSGEIRARSDYVIIVASSVG